MNELFKCCLWPSAVSGTDSDEQHLAGRTLTVAKEPSIRRRSIPIVGLSQACATACASLPTLPCEQWPQRFANSLANLEGSLRCSARLVVYSPEGFPWVFTPIDWFAENSYRLILTHLVDVLANQEDDVLAIVRRPRKPYHGMGEIFTCSYGHAISLDPDDLLAMPICQPCMDTTAALLLSWDRPPEKLACNSEKTCNTLLSVSDLKELRRLALFLGYGLLGDPQHARYVTRVCRRLALMASAPSLHDLVTNLLDGVHDLLLTKFGVHFQPILAAMHGTAAPTVLFVQRPSAHVGGGGGQLRSCGSEVQMQLSVLLNAYGSTSGGPSSARANGNMTPAALDTGGSLGTMLTTSGGCIRHEPSRVRAIKTSLAHTLLLQTLKQTCATPTPLREHAGIKDASSRFSQRPSTNEGSRGDTTKPNGSGASSLRTCVTATVPGCQPCRTPPILPVIVPNASSHVLEDQQPCRDVLLCSKLTGGKAGSILLMAEAAGSCAATSPDSQLLFPTLRSPGNGYSVGSPAAALLGGEEEPCACACAILSSEAGRSGGVSAQAGAHGAAAAAAALAASTRQTPYQLALYLLSGEVLPAGMLRMIADELQALLPTLFAAWRADLASTETSSATVIEWRRLQEQLLGQAASPDGICMSGVGIGASDPSCMTTCPATAALPLMAVTPPPAPILESACNSPLSPVAVPRSAASSRLFKCNVPTSPLPGLHSNNAVSLPPALSASNGAPLLPASGGLPGLRVALGSTAASSQGGGLPRKGMAALLTMREYSMGCTPQHAMSMPGSATGAAAAAAGVSAYGSTGGRSFKVSSLTTQLHARGFAQLHLSGVPQVTLENPAGASALDMLVTSIRQGLTSAGADEQEEQAVQAQDLAAVQLLEVLGRGGQGVVFRGNLHGLETAVKVLTDVSGGGGDDQRGEGRGAAAAQAQHQRDGANAGVPGAGPDAAGGDGRNCTGADTWDVDSKAGEARIRQAKRGAMEVAVIGTLSHPSIVQVYATFSGVVVVRCQYHDSPHTEMRLCYPGDDILAGKDPGSLNQVICLEYCDAGTLLTAARAGAFRLPFALPSNGPAFPALVPLYKSLLEVALALRYLHARKLVHCDLKAANVLLKSSSRDFRGWTCKLSDFGCARMLTEVDPSAGGEGVGAVGFRTAAPVGTLAHMAPECFIKGCLLTAAVDIYSFGILMWELLMCGTPYAGMNAKDVPRQVIRQHLRPKFHALAPANYSNLAARCWSSKPERRPNAMELVRELEHLLAAAQASSEREAQVAVAAAAARSCLQRIDVGGTHLAPDVVARGNPPLKGEGKVAPPPSVGAAAAGDNGESGGVDDDHHDPQIGTTAASRIQTAARRLLLQPTEQQQTSPTARPSQLQLQLQQRQLPQYIEAAAAAAAKSPGRLHGAELQSPRHGQQAQHVLPGHVGLSCGQSNAGQVAKSGIPPSTDAVSAVADGCGRHGGGNTISHECTNSSENGRTRPGSGSRSGILELQKSAIHFLALANQDTF